MRVYREQYLKGYSSGQSHFSEINAKLAEENEFVTHFVQKWLETRENEQNVVLNESSEALGNRSEIVRILVLAMTTADDGVGASNSVWEDVARFSLFYKQNGCFLGSLKAKQFQFQRLFLTDPYVTSRDLHGRKSYKFGVQVNSSRLCSMRALGSTQRNQFTQTSLSKVCSMYWQKYKSQIVGTLFFLTISNLTIDL